MVAITPKMLNKSKFSFLGIDNSSVAEKDNTSLPRTFNYTLAVVIDMNESAVDYVQWMPTSGDLNTFKFVFNTILILLGIATISTNILIMVIYTSMKRKTRHKTANLLLFNQAIVDLFNGTITNGITVFGKSQCLSNQIIYQFSLALSFHTIILVSLERYLFIIKPLVHRKSVTRIRVIYGIIISWVSSALWIPFRLAHLISKHMNWHNYSVYYIGISDAIFFVLIVTVIYFYVATFKVVKRFIHRSCDRVTRTNSCRDTLTRDEMKLKEHLKEIKIIKIFISMFAAFLISYLPLFLTGLIHVTVSASFTHFQLQIMSIDIIFYLSNGLFNPVVTLFYKEDYRKYLKILLKRITRHTFGTNRSLIQEFESSYAKQETFRRQSRLTHSSH